MLRVFIQGRGHGLLERINHSCIRLNLLEDAFFNLTKLESFSRLVSQRFTEEILKEVFVYSAFLSLLELNQLLNFSVLFQGLLEFGKRKPVL